MTRLMNAIRTHLDGNFHYHPHPDGNGFEMIVRLERGSLLVNIRIQEETDRVTVYSGYGFQVPEEQRFACAELVCRANYGLILGNFEMDMRDGELRYKTSCDFGSLLRIDDSQIRPLLATNFLTADRYIPAFLTFLYGGKTPEEAVELVEGIPVGEDQAPGEDVPGGGGPEDFPPEELLAAGTGGPTAERRRNPDAGEAFPEELMRKLQRIRARAANSPLPASGESEEPDPSAGPETEWAELLPGPEVPGAAPGDDDPEARKQRPRSRSGGKAAPAAKGASKRPKRGGGSGTAPRPRP